MNSCDGLSSSIKSLESELDPGQNWISIIHNEISLSQNWSVKLVWSPQYEFKKYLAKSPKIPIIQTVLCVKIFIQSAEMDVIFVDFKKDEV